MFLSFFAVPVGVFLLVGLVVPRRWHGLLWFVLALTILAIVIALSREKVDGPGGAFGIVVLAFGLFGTLLGAGVAFVLKRLWPGLDAAEPDGEASGQALGACAGLAIPPLVYVGVPVLAPATTGDTAFSVVAALAVAGAIGGVAVGRRAAWRDAVGLAGVGMVTFATSSMVVLVCAASTALKVRDTAIEASGGRAFCLQVVNGRAYRPARSWRDLSPLTMQAPSSNGVPSRYHALLVVRRDSHLEILNWSYRQGIFRPDVKVAGALAATPTVSCVPTTKGLAGAQVAATQPVLVAGRWWRIPADYGPRFSDGPSAHLAFFADAPEFAPARNGPTRRNGQALVMVEFNPKLDLETWGGSTFRRTLLRDQAGRVETWTTCYDPDLQRLGHCQMRFRRGGREYSFSLRPIPQSEWRRVQDNLVRKVESFQVGVEPDT